MIAKKSKRIPSNILNWGLNNSFWDPKLIILTLNIISGILNNITNILPIAKFLSFSKFIELDRDDNDVSTGDPIKKVKSNNFVLSGSTCNNKHASGIIIRKGSWKKSQVVNSFKITTNSIENPQIKNKTKH